MTDTPHIAVLGAGSIGCYLGGLLSAGGASVTFIGRERYKTAILENGLKLTHLERDPVHLRDVDFQTAYKSLGIADIILLCTKSQDSAESAKLILKHAREDVQVISFQNGIRNPEILRSILPKASIVAGIVPFNVTPLGAGHFHCGTAGALVVGDNVNAYIPKMFKTAGQSIKVDPDIVAAQWAKMIVNLNNALNMLSGGTLRGGLVQRNYRRALAACVEEALGVARANGIEPSQFNGRTPAQLLTTLRLPNWIYKIIMQLIVKIDAKARSSMLDDLEAGRVSEIDYLQGEIVRHAKSAGISAPYNSKILELSAEAFAAGISPQMSGTEIYQALNSGST